MSVFSTWTCDGTTTTRRTQCGLGCAAGCGGWAGSDTCFTHRFAALSALLPHGRFARCAPHAAIAAALAQQYLPCRPHGINAIRPVEMAVGPVCRVEMVCRIFPVLQACMDFCSRRCRGVSLTDPWSAEPASDWNCSQKSESLERSNP